MTSQVAKMIRDTDLIILDEIVIRHRFFIEAVDRALCDLTRLATDLGGKCVLFSGVYIQISHIIPGISRSQI